MCSHQIDTFAASKDEWDTKKGTGKYMEKALYILKAPLELKRCHRAKSICSLSHHQVTLVCRQSVRQLVGRPVETSVR